jgi:hypothetical protein
MKNKLKKFLLVPLLLVICLLVPVLTSLASLFTSLHSRATRLYPENTTDVVAMNQPFVYQLPADSLGLPFGFYCFPLSPTILENGKSQIIATTIHNGQTVGIMPDPVNNILLPPNSKVSIHISGKCYFNVAIGAISLPIEYSISHETFQVGEARYSQDEFIQLLSNYFEDPFPPNFFEQIPFQ